MRSVFLDICLLVFLLHILPVIRIRFDERKDGTAGTWKGTQPEQSPSSTSFIRQYLRFITTFILQRRCPARFLFRFNHFIYLTSFAQLYVYHSCDIFILLRLFYNLSRTIICHSYHVMTKWTSAMICYLGNTFLSLQEPRLSYSITQIFDRFSL